MEKIPVGVLGATGAVGQNLVALLQHHPWFEIAALGASERSTGRTYGEFWRLKNPLLPEIAEMVIAPCTPGMPCDLVFSGLDSSVAGEIELEFAEAGYQVVSNCRNHRMDPSVPLVVPEVNGDQLSLIDSQSQFQGSIVTNPNCVVVALAIALKPLADAFGLRSVSVMSMQAISGAGFSGLDPDLIADNVLTCIAGEERKIESELAKIFGPLPVSAHCNRVPVPNGHTLCVEVAFNSEASEESILEAWRSFKGLDLPSSPKEPVIYIEEAPQPKKHLRPMEVVTGRLRPSSLGGWKFVILSDNCMRGAAGSAILNAELLISKFSVALSSFSIL
jgi:aspartate-semialdehyde dehydrogenase